MAFDLLDWGFEQFIRGFEQITVILVQWDLAWETTAMKPRVLKDHVILAQRCTF